MTLNLNRRPAVLVLAATATCAASSCSSPRFNADVPRTAGLVTPHAPAAAQRGASVRSIAQLDHGRQARFATCTPPACPAVTPKTLAVDPPDAAAALVDTGPAPDPAHVDSPSPGESFAVSAALAPAAPTERPASRAAATPEPVTEVVVSFTFGSAVLTAAASAAIDAAAKADGIRRIDIRGRTDNVGPAAANNAVARRRAAVVAQYLRDRHPRLASAELNVDARGSCCYAADNGTPQGRARNRRVEIAFRRDPSDL